MIYRDEDMEFHIFQKGISPKVKIIVKLDVELADLRCHITARKPPNYGNIMAQKRICKQCTYCPGEALCVSTYASILCECYAFIRQFVLS